MRNSANITAHSGCDGTEADSLESIQRGLGYGADVVELDVRLDRRGRPVLSHDGDTARVYGGRPGLDEAMDLLGPFPRAGINCDVKEPEAVPAILELAAQRGLGPERLILTGSVSPPALRENPRIQKRASVWMNIEEIIREFLRTGHEALAPYEGLVEAGFSAEKLLTLLAPHFSSLVEPLTAGCRAWGLGVINMPYAEISPPLILRLREGGIQASVWTINREDQLRRLFGLGVLNITTRNTPLAVKLRSEIPGP